MQTATTNPRPEQHKVNCKKCGAEVTTTDFEAWKRHGETCFRCKHKLKKSRRKKPVSKKEVIKIQKDDEEALKKQFSELLKLRKEYFDFLCGVERNSGIISKLEQFFEVDLFDAFCVSSKLEFSEFFNMGEDTEEGFNWNDLVAIIDKYKKTQYK